MPKADNSLPHPCISARLKNISGYVLAVVIVSAAFGLRIAFDPIWGPRLPYAWFFLAVTFMTFFTGTGPQLFAVAAGLLLGDWFFVPPRFSLAIEDRLDQVNALLYVCICLVVVLFSWRARRASARELAARDRIAGILECTSDAVCTLDSDWRITYFNKRAAALTRLTTNGVMGRIFWEAWPEIVDTRFAAEFHGVMDQRQPVHFEEYDQLLGKWIEIHACPYGEGMAIFFRDVDDRKRAEASRAQLAAIVESSDDAIVGQSRSGTIVTWNAAAERLYGFTAADAIGRPISMLFPDEVASVLANVMEQVRRGERVSHIETKQLRRNGTLADVSLTISPVQKADLQQVVFSLTARDISERKRSEMERERLFEELREAMAQVKTLTGLLPICAQCKKIRDENGSWNQIELYIRDRSNAKFSHGICPDCARRFYPQLYTR